jgi:hypothetical protein
MDSFNDHPLHQRGLKLSTQNFNDIFNSIGAGYKEAQRYLNVPIEVTFIFTNIGTNIHFVADRTTYTPNEAKINIPIPYLNRYAEEMSIPGRTVDTITMAYGSIEHPITLREDLECGGIEEFIHVCQYHQINGFVVISDSEINAYKQLDTVHQHICDFEVEAQRWIAQIRSSYGKSIPRADILSKRQQEYATLFGKPPTEILKEISNPTSFFSKLFARK